MATTFKTSSTNISQNCFVECSFFRNFAMKMVKLKTTKDQIKTSRCIGNRRKNYGYK